MRLSNTGQQQKENRICPWWGFEQSCNAFLPREGCIMHSDSNFLTKTYLIQIPLDISCNKTQNWLLTSTRSDFQLVCVICYTGFSDFSSWCVKNRLETSYAGCVSGSLLIIWVLFLIYAMNQSDASTVSAHASDAESEGAWSPIARYKIQQQIRMAFEIELHILIKKRRHLRTSLCGQISGSFTDACL